MKADVIPPRLDVPSWVPEPIARYASYTYGADVGRVSQVALESLVCDPRMESVWRQLSRPARNGAFLYPARPSSAPTARGRQDAAMLQLFSVACRCQELHGETTMTRGQAEQQRNCFLAKAEELKTDALMMRMQPRLLDELADEAAAHAGYASNEERYQKLLAAAQAYEDYAGELNFAGALEREHDGRARWVALTIADAFRTLFGKPMYGLTATIASVILGREIDPRTVRWWCAYPAVKPPKIAH
jgi:hypothetical protein